MHPQRLDGAFRHEGLAHERDDPRGPAEVCESVHRSREVSGAAFLPAMEVGAVVAAIGLVHLVDRRVPTLARDGVSGAPDVFPEVLQRSRQAREVLRRRLCGMSTDATHRLHELP